MRQRGGGGGVLRRCSKPGMGGIRAHSEGIGKDIKYSIIVSSGLSGEGGTYPYVRYISIASIARMKMAVLFSGEGGITVSAFFCMEYGCIIGICGMEMWIISN